jgi:hypothetical protein
MKIALVRWIMAPVAAICAAIGGGCVMSGHLNTGAGENRVTTCDAPKEVEASPFYRVTVNGKSAFVCPCAVSRIANEKGELLPDRHQTTQTLPAAFCSFDFSGRAEVEVTVQGPALHVPLTNAVVRPLRHGIRPTITGQTLRFTLEQPCQISVEPNGAILAPLFIFVSPPALLVNDISGSPATHASRAQDAGREDKEAHAHERAVVNKLFTGKALQG